MSVFQAPPSAGAGTPPCRVCGRSIFAFSGHKQSFFGDLHCLGKDGVRFFTEVKAVTTHWFDEEEKKSTVVDTWEGSVGGSI